MNRRNFLSYCALLGLTIPFLPKKEVDNCKKKWRKIGKITIQRVGPVENKEIEYFPYEEYLQNLWDNSWEKRLGKAKEYWIKNYQSQETNIYYNVYENNVIVGRLILFKQPAFISDSCIIIQFESFVLDELITVKNWCDNMDFNESISNPQKTAKYCVRLFRKKARGILHNIVKYYNLKEMN